MKKIALFTLPFAALLLAAACKKQEAVPAAEQVAGTAVEAAPAAAPAAAPEKKGN